MLGQVEVTGPPVPPYTFGMKRVAKELGLPLPPFMVDWKQGSLSTVAKRPHKAWAVWPYRGWRERKQHRIWWSIFWQGVNKDLNTLPETYALGVESLRLQMDVNAEWFVQFFCDAARRWYLNGSARRALFQGMRGRGENTAQHFVTVTGWEALPKMLIDAEVDEKRFLREVGTFKAIVRVAAAVAVSAIAGGVASKIAAAVARKKAEAAAAAGASPATVEEVARSEAAKAIPAASAAATQQLAPEVTRRVVEKVVPKEQLGEAEGRAEDAANLRAASIPKSFWPPSAWKRFKKMVAAIFGWAA